jgi:hypothetical protein
MFDLDSLSAPNVSHSLVCPADGGRDALSTCPFPAVPLNLGLVVKGYGNTALLLHDIRTFTEPQLETTRRLRLHCTLSLSASITSEIDVLVCHFNIVIIIVFPPFPSNPTHNNYPTNQIWQLQRTSAPTVASPSRLPTKIRFSV